MKKRLLSLLMAVVMIFGLTPTSVLPAVAAGSEPIPADVFPAGQTGTFDHPYVISNPITQLLYMDSKFGANNFILDTNLNQISIPPGDISFSGYLEGNGHTVTGLARPLFKKIEQGARVANLRFQNGSYTAPGGKSMPQDRFTMNYPHDNVGFEFRDIRFGFLAGESWGILENISIENSVIDVSPKTDYPYGSIGFLVGRCSGGSMRNCTNVGGTVKYAGLMMNVGGLVGYRYWDGGSFVGCGVHDLTWQNQPSMPENTYPDPSEYPPYSKESNELVAGSLVGISKTDNEDKMWLDHVFVTGIYKQEGSNGPKVSNPVDSPICPIAWVTADAILRCCRLQVPNIDWVFRTANNDSSSLQQNQVIELHDYGTPNEYSIDFTEPDITSFNSNVDARIAKDPDFRTVYKRNASSPYLPVDGAYQPELKPESEQNMVRVTIDKEYQLRPKGSELTMELWSNFFYEGRPTEFKDEWLVTDERTGEVLATLRSTLENPTSNAYTLDRSVVVTHRYNNIYQNYIYTSETHSIGTEYRDGLFTQDKSEAWPGGGGDAEFAALIGQPGPDGNFWYTYQELTADGSPVGQPVTEITDFGRYEVNFGFKPGFDRPYAFVQTWIDTIPKAEVWNVGPMTAENTVITNATAGYTGSPVEADIPRLKLDGVQATLSYEGTDGTVYTKSTTPPTELGTYKVYVTVAERLDGATFEQCWAETTDSFVGNMTISAAGLRVLVDGVAAQEGFVLKNGLELRHMKNGIIRVDDLSSIDFNILKTVGDKNVPVCTWHNYDQLSATLRLSSLQVYAANNGLDVSGTPSYPSDPIDLSQAVGLVEPFIDKQNLLPSRFVRQYLIPENTKLSEVITGDPQVPLTQTDTEQFLPFREWQDADGNPVDLSTATCSSVGGKLVAAYDPLPSPTGDALGLVRGETYYVFDSNSDPYEFYHDSCITSPRDPNNDPELGDLTGGQRLFPMVFAGDYRWDHWIVGIYNDNNSSTVKTALISKHAFERNSRVLYDGPTHDLLYYSNGIIGSGVQLQIPTMGVIRDRLAASAPTDESITQNFMTAENPWNDRTQLSLLLGDVADVKSPTGLESAREVYTPGYYDSIRSYALTRADGTAVARQREASQHGPIGIRLVAEITERNKNSALVVTLNLGEYAKDSQEKTIKMLLSENVDRSSNLLGHYTLPTMDDFYKDLLLPTAMVWTDEQGRVYNNGENIPADVRTLWASNGGLKPLTHQDCVDHGLDDSYVGWFGISTPEQLRTALSGTRNIVLLDDIDLSNTSETILELSQILDGNGRTITGAPSDFFQTLSGTVRNIQFDRPAGILIQEFSGSLENVTVNNSSDAVIDNASGNCSCTDVTVTDCEITPWLTANPRSYKAVLINNAAYAYSVTLRRCYTSGTIYGNDYSDRSKARYDASGLMHSNRGELNPIDDSDQKKKKGPYPKIIIDQCRSDVALNVGAYSDQYSGANSQLLDAHTMEYTGTLTMTDCLGLGLTPRNIAQSAGARLFHRYYQGYFVPPFSTKNCATTSGKYDEKISNTNLLLNVSDAAAAAENAWKLNTTNGTEAHSGLWGVSGDHPDLVSFSGVDPVYKITWTDASGSNPQAVTYGSGLLDASETPAWAAGKQLKLNGSQSIYLNDYRLTADVAITVAEGHQLTAEMQTAPAPADLTYTAQSQALVTAGAGKDGAAVRYSLSQNGPFESTIPQGKDASTYTVWYRAEADGKAPSAAQSVTVTIKPAAMEGVTVRQEGKLVLNGDLMQAPVVTKTETTTLGRHPIRYTYSLTADGNYTAALPTFNQVTEGTTVYFKANADNHSEFRGQFTVVVVELLPQELSYAATELTKVYGEPNFTNPLTRTTVTGALSYTSSVPGVASVNTETGEVTILSTGTTTITANAAQSETHKAASASYTLTIAPKQVTASFTGATFTYDGSPKSPVLSVMDGEKTVAESEYTVSYEKKTGDTFAPVQPSEVTDVGTYKLVVTDNELGNYTVSGEQEFTINPAIITGSITQKGQLFYDGTPKTAEVNNTLAAKGGQTIQVNYSKTVGDYTAAMPTFTEVGTYTVYFEATAPNHSTLTGSFQVEVKKSPIASAPAAITAPEANGVPQTSFSGTGYTGTVTWTPAAETFGYNTVYTANVTLTPDASHSFTADAVQSTGLTGAVLNDDGTITGTRVFDATRKAKITSVSGQPADQTLAEYCETEARVMELLPQTVTITAEDGTSTLDLSWSVVGSYDPTAEQTNRFTWTADAGQLDPNGQALTGTITVTNTDALSVTLTFEDATITYGETYTPNATADQADGTITYTYKQNGTVVTAPRNAGTYTVTAVFQSSTHHGEKTVTLTIEPKPVTITGLSADSKIYDGSANADVTGTAVLNGTLTGDDVTVKTGTASFPDKNVGTNRTVTFSGYALEGTAKDNYLLSAQPASVTADITVREVSITGLTAQNRPYDEGVKTVTLLNGTISGSVPNDDVTIDLTDANAVMADANAGSGKPVTVTGVKLAGTDAGNYNLTGWNDVTVNISKAAYSGSKTASDTVFTTGESGKTVELPAIPEGAAYGTPVSTKMTGMSISGSTLTYTAPACAAQEQIIITVPVTGAANYSDYEITVTITAVDETLTGIRITHDPAKTQYVEGQSFDPAGMEVTASYDSGASRTVTGWTVTDGSSLTLGDTSVTVSYTEGDVTKTATQTITVIAKALTGIAITHAPDQTAYIEGQNFNSTGMEVTASYNDGTTAVVSGWTVLNGESLTVDDTFVTVSYTEDEVIKTATQTITVSLKTLTSIAITQAPTKVTYVEGQSFDPTGMEVTASYDNGTSAVVSGWTVTGGENLAVDDASVTVSYTVGNVTKTATQAITVIAKAMTGIAITGAPDQTAYVEGQSFNSTGMEVTASYNDETTAVVNGWTVTGGENLTVGSTSVTVSYTEGSVTQTATQTISVAAKAMTGITITQAPTKIAYIEGQNFDPTGMEVTASYNDETAAVVTGWTVTDGENLAANATSITVSYTEGGVTKTATQNIIVNAKALTGITITQAPTKIAYIEGQSFDPTGMEVTASYDNGATAVVTGWTVTDGENLTVGSTSVTVSYTVGDVTKTVTQTITVTAKAMTGITITQVPTRTEYIEGQSFDPTGMEVTASYDNGTTAVVTGWTVTNGENLTVDSTSVTVSYTEGSVTKTATQAITVSPAAPPAEYNPIEAQFVKGGWLGKHTTTLTVELGGSIQAPNANGFFQRGSCWKSEDGTLFVDSKGTVTYDQLLKVLGGTAEQGAYVRFVVARESDRPVEPQPEPTTQIVTVSFMDGTTQVGRSVKLEVDRNASVITSAQVQKYLPQGYQLAQPDANYAIKNGTARVPVTPIGTPDPQTQTVTIRFLDGTEEVAAAELDVSSGINFLTAAQVYPYLPKGYDFAEAGQDYAIVNGIAEVPVVPVEPVEPVGSPITVTFKLSGWGQYLKGTRSKTMTVTLNPGQSVTAPYAGSCFGRTKSVNWSSSLSYQVTSGDTVHYETLAELMGTVPENARVTFTGSASRR